MIKAVLAWLPCHVLLHIGGFFSKIVKSLPDDEAHEQMIATFSNIYCGFMLWSIWWNDFGGLEVWGKADE